MVKDFDEIGDHIRQEFINAERVVLEKVLSQLVGAKPLKHHYEQISRSMISGQPWNERIAFRGVDIGFMEYTVTPTEFSVTFRPIIQVVRNEKKYQKL